MKKFVDSEYRKAKSNIYFDTRARYGREADTIIFWHGITPKGNVSQYFATLRINSERNISSESKMKYVVNYVFPKLPKGYTWSEPFLYSGDV